MADLIPSINTNANAPLSAEQDGLRAEQQPIAAQILADRYIKANTPTPTGLPGRTLRLKPGNNADWDVYGD
ncbi:MAG: hypothetical protein ABSF29_12825 [Tepidisphaeraceae bacterium]|jgi:hypothetical protein